MQRSWTALGHPTAYLGRPLLLMLRRLARILTVKLCKELVHCLCHGLPSTCSGQVWPLTCIHHCRSRRRVICSLQLKPASASRQQQSLQTSALRTMPLVRQSCLAPSHIALPAAATLRHRILAWEDIPLRLPVTLVLRSALFRSLRLCVSPWQQARARPSQQQHPLQWPHRPLLWQWRQLHQQQGRPALLSGDTLFRLLLRNWTQGMPSVHISTSLELQRCLLACTLHSSGRQGCPCQGLTRQLSQRLRLHP